MLESGKKESPTVLVSSSKPTAVDTKETLLVLSSKAKVLKNSKAETCTLVNTLRDVLKALESTTGKMEAFTRVRSVTG